MTLKRKGNLATKTSFVPNQRSKAKPKQGHKDQSLRLRVHTETLVPAELDKIQNLSGKNRREFMDALASSGHLSGIDIANHLAKQYNVQKVNLSEFEPDPNVIMKVPKRICEKYNIIPLTEVEGTIIVASFDPGDVEAKGDVSSVTNSKVEMVVADLDKIKEFIEIYYSKEQNMKNVFFAMESKNAKSVEPELPFVDLDEINSNPVIQSTNYLISEGIQTDCSDIHLEIYEKSFRVRYRIDGRLCEFLSPPLSSASAIINRVKVLTGMDISEKRLPQDGRLKVKCGRKTVSFRVSCIPVISGEKIVLRILDTSSVTNRINNLGMDKEQLGLFRKYLGQSQGFILVTGPTGSGKTTTLYSGLVDLNTISKNLSTVEDPVEFKLPGINQVQVNPKIGFGFASAMRSFLRQDPDVILVGEIRDIETANMAYHAAATGHLVLSTLHTNDVTSTITRLLDIGIPAYSVAENTSLVISQRLVRVLCLDCKVYDKVNTKILVNLGFSQADAEQALPKIMKGEGCRDCNNTGYKGRVAVFEMLEISSELKQGILQGISPRKMKKLAIERSNLQTLRAQALKLLSKGITSIEEVLYGTLEDE